MRKTIASILVVLALSTAMIGPSQAYWTVMNGNYYWCDSYGCR